MRKLNCIVYCIVLSCLAMVNMTSCLDILEKHVSSDITIDTIYSNRQYAESHLFRVYHLLVPRGFPFSNAIPNSKQDQYYPEFAGSLLASITDECCNARGATWGWYVNKTGFDATSSAYNQEDGFGFRWKGIRAAYIFIENIDRVPENEIGAAEKMQMKAEAKTLVALAYQEMLFRYGGIPIVRNYFDTSSTSLIVTRSSVADVIDFILSLCDEALPYLPDTYASNMKGRITKGVPLAIKSRVLLYAASPLVNSAASESPLPCSQPEFISYCNYSKERWLAAANAANDVLKWAKTKGGVSLVTAEDIPGGEIDPKHNAYGYATSVKDNKEIIFANKGYSSSNNGFSDGIFWKFSIRGMSVMQSFIYNFRKADGSDQSWPTIIGERRPFSEYLEKVGEMEPRFYQCCWPVGKPAPNFSSTGSYAKWPFNYVDDMMTASDMFGACPMVKFHYNYNTSVKMQDWIVFRLAEFYLNYAEAVNEYYGPNGKVEGAEFTAVEAVDVIRKRGGIRELSDTEKSDKTKFSEQIRRERAVELFAEGHRFFDCKRWKIAVPVFGQRLHTLRYVQNASKDNYDYYYLALHEPRVWTNAMYFHPFPQEEVDKGYLVQNPGY